jgi:hypothetical protein
MNARYTSTPLPVAVAIAHVLDSRKKVEIFSDPAAVSGTSGKRAP